jgi:hypothetical protein
MEIHHTLIIEIRSSLISKKYLNGLEIELIWLRIGASGGLM